MADEAPNWDALRRMYPTLDMMMLAGQEPTRENYIQEAYGADPGEWTPEHEAELPEPFRKSA